MPASPSSERTVEVRLGAGSPLAEVFLIDHEFSLVDRAIGRLRVDVAPGVYKVKAQLGEVLAERLVVVDEDCDIDLADDLRLTSPVPLEGSSHTREYHADAAFEVSRGLAPAEAGGALVSIVARRWDEQAREGREPEAAWLSTVSLHDPGGAVVLKLAKGDVHREAGRDPHMSRADRVEPGGYVLRWHDRSGLATEQAVHAVEGWETEVFLLDAFGGGPAGVGTVRTSILMSRSGFEPGDEMLQRVEEARGALAEERRVASQAVNEQLFAKFDNPMLGLFGAHLMLIARDALREGDDERRVRSRGGSQAAPVDFDQALFDTAVHNLFDLLGAEHPDVVALATQVSEPDPAALAPVALPPMLSRSWKLLVEASNDAPALLPADTWRRAHRVVAAEPFLAWSPVADAGAAWQEWKDAARARLSRGEEETEEELRRRLSREAVAPRAVIDELLADQGP